MPFIPENRGSKRDTNDFNWDEFDELCQMPNSMYTNEQIALDMGYHKDSISDAIRNKYDMTFSEYREVRQRQLNKTLFKTQIERAQHMKSDFGMLRWLGINCLGQSDDPKGLGRHVVVTRCYSNPKRSQGQE